MGQLNTSISSNTPKYIPSNPRLHTQRYSEYTLLVGTQVPPSPHIGPSKQT